MVGRWLEWRWWAGGGRLVVVGRWQVVVGGGW